MTLPTLVMCAEKLENYLPPTNNWNRCPGSYINVVVGVCSIMTMRGVKGRRRNVL